LDNLARIKIARPDIEAYFKDLSHTVLLRKDLGKILEDNRTFWRLTKTISTDKFIELLRETSQLQEITLFSPNYNKSLSRYTWGANPSVYQAALSLKPNSYLSHYTAMFLNNLTLQIPKTIYLNTEQSKKPLRPAILEQTRIDLAFKGKGRVSQYIFNYDNWKICCINGKNTNNLGVEELQVSEAEKVPVTTIERTLIDIAVRPVYAGGIYEVLNAFKEAKGKCSANKLFAILKKIDYVYPYHQVIGFYMERAGYQESQLHLARKIEMKYDFYLDYGMKETDYSKEWRLFFPKNF
jgi:predicted transcriptional regulator of viral defense system